MFETFTASPPEVILQIAARFNADQRRGKMDLGLGVYRDKQGRTPVMAAVVPEMLLAYSCSKNFAIYRERTGFALALSRDAQTAARTMGKMNMLVRGNHSMPPDHGAAVVRIILQDPQLSMAWRAELGQMRQRVAGMCKALASSFRTQLNTGQLDFIAQQQGMFHYCPSRLNTPKC